MRALFTLALVFVTTILRPNDPLVELPFKIINEHIHFKLTIDQSEPLHFVFDTGAKANLMHENTASRLGLQTLGQQMVRGASGSTTVQRTMVQSVGLKGLHLNNVNFLVMNIDHLMDEDSPLDGVIGAEILNNYVVEINYDQSLIKLYDMGKFKKPEGWQTAQFSLRTYGIPIISSTITLPSGERLTGNYFVDTGAAVTLKLNTPFVNQNELKAKLGPNYSYTSRALSSESEDKVNLLPAYEFFGYQFTNFSIRLSQSTTGVSGFQGFHGIVGLNLLKRFNTIYHYGEKEMYLKKSVHFDEAFPSNHDGVKVKKVNGAFLVEDVFPHSAGFKAGIQKGDIIVSVDGKADFTQHKFHRYFQFQTSAVNLIVERSGKTLHLTLTPQPMLKAN